MSTSQDHIVNLWNRFVAKTATKQELDELFIYLQQTDNDNTNLELIQQYLGNNTIEEINKEYWLNKAEEITKENIRIAHRVHFLRTAWFRYAAAILIIAGIGAYLWNNNLKVKTENSKTAKTGSSNEILPGGQKALLTLADGSTIELDSAANGQLATQGNLKIIKLEDGQIIYNYERGSLSPAGGSTPRSARGEGGLAATNTMSTPRGGQYQLTLPDNTKVWLNASSSITYPVVFNEKTRTVSITGEAYFQITANPRQPFIVKTKSEEITVLGTEFNVNSYADEPISKTSLVTGSIHVNSAGPYPPLAGEVSPKAKRGWTLKPGQAFSNGKIITTNISNDIAWKNGYFSFTDADIKTVMRQLSRWYDIDVKYSGAIPTDEFNGKIGRDLTLSQVLKILSKTRINYRIENKTIIVLP